MQVLGFECLGVCGLWDFGCRVLFRWVLGVQGFRGWRSGGNSKPLIRGLQTLPNPVTNKPSHNRV